MFSEGYLRNYHLKLIPYLNKRFFQNKSSICCFLDDEYTYRGHDWYSGETWSVSLSESIKYSEKIKMDEIKRKNVK